MATYGITWHAVVVEAEDCAANRDLIVRAHGLQPTLEVDGVVMFSFHDGTRLELRTPATIPPYGLNPDGTAFGFRVDDVAETSEELAAAGVELLGEHARMPALDYAPPLRGPDGRIFRVQDGKIVEHWDVLQPEEQNTASGRPMFEAS